MDNRPIVAIQGRPITKIIIVLVSYRPMTDARQKNMVLFGLPFAVAAALFVVAVHLTGVETEVAKVYFPYADSLFNGTVPEMEYPPFALVFLSIPRIFASSPTGYEIAFVIEALVFFLIGLWCTSAIASKLNQSPRRSMMIYTVAMLLVIEFVLDRYDIFPVVLVMLSLYCLVTKRYVLAWILLSVATMTKLYPAVLMPLYLIPLLADRDWKNALKGVSAFVLTALIIALPFLLTDPETALGFIGYHSDRPLQLESVTASLIYPFSLLGITDMSQVFSYGSENLIGAWPDAIVGFLMPLTVVLLIVLYAVSALLLRRMKISGIYTEQNRIAIIGATFMLSVMIFILAGKVFSGQYMMWMVSFLPFVALVCTDNMSRKYLLPLFFAAEILVQVAFGINSGLTPGELNTVGMLAVLVKNLAVIAVFLLFIRSVAGRFRHLEDNGRNSQKNDARE